jgi:hypothetical protein
MTSHSPSQALLNQERLVRASLLMARDSRLEQQQRARRTAERMASALGVVAAVIAVYDLSLLAVH